MTLRLVVERAEVGATELAVHGWLSGPEVAEFERVAGTVPLPMRIDLSQLAGADQAGLLALCAQRARGACLANASPYISLLIKAQEEAGPGRPPSPHRGGISGQ
jgi:hypothetical protein